MSTLQSNLVGGSPEPQALLPQERQQPWFRKINNAAFGADPMRRLLVAEHDLDRVESWRDVLCPPNYEMRLLQDTHQARLSIEQHPSGFVCDFAVVNADAPGSRPVLRLLTTFRPSPQIVAVSERLDGPRTLSLLEHCHLVLPSPVDGSTLHKAFCMLEANHGENFVVGGFVCAHGLSRREAQILNATIMGLSSKEIAFDLRCSPSTVATYLQRIFRKTNTRSQRQLLVAVLRHACSGNAAGVAPSVLPW